MPDPRPRWVVTRVEVSDGRPDQPGGDPLAADEAQELEYASFRFDHVRRESFGARAAESVVAPGTPEATFTRSAFHQAPELRGKLQYAEVCDAGACYRAEETQWIAHAPVADAYLARPKTTSTRVCDASTPVCDDTVVDSQLRVVERVFDFEAGSGEAGNLVEETDCGVDTLCGGSGAADDLVRTRAYAENLDAWMVSYVEEESVYFGAVDVANPVSRARMHYDIGTFSPGAGTTPERCIGGSTAGCGGLVRFRETLREGDPVNGTWAVEAWAYDAFGNMASYTDPEAYAAGGPATQAVAYDTAAYNTFPLSLTNALGHVSQFRFDEGLGEVTKALAPNGYLQCWGRDAFGRLTSRGEHSVAVDPVANPSWESLGCNTSLAAFAFQAIGDPTQQHILATLEAGGGLDAVRSLRFFDGLGREYQSESESHRDAFDVVTRAWGSRGELVCETLPYRRTGGVAGASPGRCDATTLSGHRLTSYDALLRPTRVQLAGGELVMPVTELTVGYGVNAFGAGTAPMGLGDLLVERREIHAGDGMMGETANRVQHVGRNARGEVVFLREGDDEAQTTLLLRDPKGRITRVDGPDVGLIGGGTDRNLIEIAYNAVDQRLRLTQPQDPNGPGPVWQWDYTLNGDVFTRTSPRGIGIRFHYDALRRLVLKDYEIFTTPAAPHPGDYVLSYHTSGPGLGQLESVVAPSSGIYEEYGYDLRGRVASKLRDYGGGQFVFAYTWDLLDRPLLTLLPDGGRLVYGHDGAVLRSLTSSLPAPASPPGTYSPDPDVFVHEIAHHPSGALEQLKLRTDHASVAPPDPTTLVSSYLYNASDHRMAAAMTTAEAGGLPTLLRDLMYDFDRAGNLRSADDMVLGGLDQRFEYDALHRLAQAEATGSEHAYGLLAYRYDAAGNLLEKGPATGMMNPQPAAGHLRLHYDRDGGGPVNVAAVERFDGAGSWVPAASYSQNQSGAVKSFTKLGASTTLWRNADDRIQSVAAGGKGYTHYYDIAGQRVAKVYSSWGILIEATRYVDASYEVDPIAETHQVHVFVGSRRVATSKRPGVGTSSTLTTTADAVQYYHPDHVGSNTLVTDPAGEVVQETVTTPFGELHALVDASGSPVAANQSATPYLFTDQEHDPETGLHYFGARYQDPWIGRFLSQDPELIGPSAGVTFERLTSGLRDSSAYSYAQNRPTSIVDPTGRYELIFMWVTAKSSTGDAIGPPSPQVIGVGGGGTGVSPISGGGGPGGGGLGLSSAATGVDTSLDAGGGGAALPTVAPTAPATAAHSPSSDGSRGNGSVAEQLQDAGDALEAGALAHETSAELGERFGSPQSETAKTRGLGRALGQLANFLTLLAAAQHLKEGNYTAAGAAAVDTGVGVLLNTATPVVGIPATAAYLGAGGSAGIGAAAFDITNFSNMPHPDAPAVRIDFVRGN